MIETIICAAIYYPHIKGDNIYVYDKDYNLLDGLVITGMRHCNCIHLYRMMCGSDISLADGKGQGFMTSKFRFLCRKDTAVIAIESGQVLEENINMRLGLFSEDIY